MQDYKQFLHIRKTLLSIWNPIDFEEYLSIEDRALFLAESKPFKKFSQFDRDKVRQVCAKDYYLPANESEHDKLWQAMEYLDPILIFERNSEGPFLRVSLLLALMASYELSLEDFASLWMCNTKNRVVQEKRDLE